MITVYGEGRGFRVVWLLEEMALPYRLVEVDLLRGVEHYPEFLAVNPAGFIPALQDGAVTMVESIAIMQYLMEAHGPTPLAPRPADPDYPAYLQFLLMGEAGISNAMFYYTNLHRIVPESERSGRFDRFVLYQFESRLKLISDRLGQAPYLAGERFTAADISTGYALDNAWRATGYAFDDRVSDYLARLRARPGYGRAMAACPALRTWDAEVRQQRAG